MYSAFSNQKLLDGINIAVCTLLYSVCLSKLKALMEPPEEIGKSFRRRPFLPAQMEIFFSLGKTHVNHGLDSTADNAYVDGDVGICLIRPYLTMEKKLGHH